MAVLYSHSINRLIHATRKLSEANALLLANTDAITIGSAMGAISCANIDIKVVLDSILIDIEVPISATDKEIDHAN